jgi:hypothetical protein
MRLLAVAPVALAVVLGSTVVGCGGSRARITVNVRPLATPAHAQCVAIAQRYVAGNRGFAQRLCTHASPRTNWYRANIAYAGGKSTWIACAVQGYDAHGQKLWKSPWGLTLTPASSFPGSLAVEMKPRSSLTVKWFLLGHQAGPVARYKPTCRTEKYPPS